MIRQKLILWAGAGLILWLLTMPGLAGAASTYIYPVDTSKSGFPVISNAPYTVSIYMSTTSGYVDTTATWTPDWVPGCGSYTTSPPAACQKVYVVFNSMSYSTSTPTGTPISFSVSPAALISSTNSSSPKTSAYPGQCTNYGDHSDVSQDFYLDASGVAIGKGTGYPLTSFDCGGSAVVSLSYNGATYTFILPQDANNNQIPDNWETSLGFALTGSGSITAGGDIDTGPAGSAIVGDGIANFDEYRGFIVSGSHIRTNPKQKDLFIHLVNPQCSTYSGITLSLLGGGGTGITTYPTDGSTLFTVLNGLISGTQIHPLGYQVTNATHFTTNEWVDNFSGYTYANGFTYTSSNGAVSDRQVNLNAVYPIQDSVAGNSIQKGLRITECLDDSTLSLWGSAGWGSANGPDNALIFTQRIVEAVNNAIGSNSTIYYKTYLCSSGKCSWQTPSGTPSPVTISFIISKAMEYVLAMEIAHGLELTTTSSTSSGYLYHDAPGTGDLLDAQIQTTSKSGTITFYIPSLYGSVDQAYLRLNN